jgi:hypothetical protein
VFVLLLIMAVVIVPILATMLTGLRAINAAVQRIAASMEALVEAERQHR